MKILFYDTESSNLSGGWGHVICASFVDLSGDVYTYRIDQRKYKGRNPADDSKLVVAIRDELEEADIIVSWNGIMHDVPLVNARLALAGEEPVTDVRHLDLMYYSRGNSMKIGSSKMDTVARYFQVNHEKTPLDPQTWRDASVGDKKAISSVVTHCEADVEVLRDLWPHLARYVKKFVIPLSQWWHLAEQI